MLLPGGKQMAKPSLPPAGCCRHAMGITVGAPWQPSRATFPLHSDFAVMPSTDYSQQNWPP